MKRIVFLVFAFTLCTFAAVAQHAKPFYNEIQGFKKSDSTQAPPKEAILFVGSSSFRMWKDVQQAFPQHTIINRGFGGSSLPHLIQYASDIILPYNARQIVIYAGENDLAASDTVSALTVLNRFQQLFYLIRERQPKTPIVFVSIKPSPSRAHLMPKIVEANRLVKAFLSQHKSTAFVDVYHPMLNESGQPKDDIFISDRLHMNEKGYAIWQKVLAPYLKK